jgi:hypothetical protein
MNDSIIIEIEVLSRYWERHVEIKNSKLVDDYSVRLEQVFCKIDNLRQLLNFLNEWLKNRASFSIELTDSSDQVLSLSLKPDAKTISSLDKPVFFVNYSAGPSVEIKWKYVVDQTCVHRMCDELDKALDRIQ